MLVLHKIGLSNALREQLSTFGYFLSGSAALLKFIAYTSVAGWDLTGSTLCSDLPIRGAAYFVLIALYPAACAKPEETV